jgi:hypothetical protein
MHEEITELMPFEEHSTIREKASERLLPRKTHRRSKVKEGLLFERHRCKELKSTELPPLLEGHPTGEKYYVPLPFCVINFPSGAESTQPLPPPKGHS